VPARKIVNEQEVIRWYEEGKTYAWMVTEYRCKYHLETVPSMFSNFARRRGLQRRITRDDDLIPWHVVVQHRWAYPLDMLRVEARRRAGWKLTTDDAARLTAWLATLRKDDLVVAYDPTTKDGFSLVRRRPGVDEDLIREPARKTTLRPAAR
jgi:hypothetical protein